MTFYFFGIDLFSPVEKLLNNSANFLCAYYVLM